jgi:hypothetical protein
MVLYWAIVLLPVFTFEGMTRLTICLWNRVDERGERLSLPSLVQGIGLLFIEFSFFTVFVRAVVMVLFHVELPAELAMGAAYAGLLAAVVQAALFPWLEELGYRWGFAVTDSKSLLWRLWAGAVEA